jgi:DnaJ-class molecular chaperone
MAGWPVTCPECDGNKGWSNVDGFWVECEKCLGTGYVDEDELEDDDEEDE